MRHRSQRPTDIFISPSRECNRLSLFPVPEDQTGSAVQPGRGGPCGPEVRQLGYPVTDNINILVQNIDTPFVDDGACEKVARKKRGRVCRNIIVHHLDIDRVLLLKVGIQPWTCLPSRVKYKSNRYE
jgi:hypothetical protein